MFIGIFIKTVLFFGRLFPLKHGHTKGNKGKDVVEALEKVLVAPGYTFYAKYLPTSGPKSLPTTSC